MPNEKKKQLKNLMSIVIQLSKCLFYIFKVLIGQFNGLFLKCFFNLVFKIY